MTSLETLASGASVLACGASGIETLTLASQRNEKCSRELGILTRKGIAMPVVSAAAMPLRSTASRFWPDTGIGS